MARIRNFHITGATDADIAGGIDLKGRCIITGLGNGGLPQIELFCRIDSGALVSIGHLEFSRVNDNHYRWSVHVTKGKLPANFAVGHVVSYEFSSGDNTLLTTDPVSITCFYPGTLIATPEGARAVENLVAGDLVNLADGRTLPVRWLGRQTIATMFTDPLKSLPIRIAAGALGENVPSRDLLVSPGHAIYVAGVLVVAGALVNGTSIVREYDVPEVFSYYHVELDEHALILAENTPTESFVDNVDRERFDNWEDREDSGSKPIVEMDLPVAKSHRQVPASVRKLIALRAAAIGAIMCEVA